MTINRNMNNNMNNNTPPVIHSNDVNTYRLIPGKGGHIPIYSISTLYIISMANLTGK